MKRKNRGRIAFSPTWLGAMAIVLVAGVLLRNQATAQTRPAPTSASPSTQRAAEEAPANTEAPGLSFWELYQKGGYCMYPLTLCSMLAVALIIERFLALRRANVIPASFLSELHALGPNPRNNVPAVLLLCQRMNSPIARMLAAGVKRLPRGTAAAEKAIEDAGAGEALKLRRNMRFLYALGSVATLLGLIGTISGMIKAFQNAAASGTGDVHKLSTGIYEAMVNTFAGLAIAIVVTVFYYYFLDRIERLISHLNDVLVELADAFHFDKAESGLVLPPLGVASSAVPGKNP